MKMMKWGVVGFGLFILLRYPVWAVVDTSEPMISAGGSKDITVTMPGEKAIVYIKRDGFIVIDKAVKLCMSDGVCGKLEDWHLKKQKMNEAAEEGDEGSGMVGISQGSAGCSKNGTCDKYIDPDVARAQGAARMAEDAMTEKFIRGPERGGPIPLGAPPSASDGTPDIAASPQQSSESSTTPGGGHTGDAPTTISIPAPTTSGGMPANSSSD